MALDAAVAPRNLTARLHYLKRGPEKPVFYRIDPPPGVPQWNGIDDEHEIRIEDARGRESEFTLDRNGFALVESPTAVVDFYDEQEIKGVYYPEVERLPLDALSAHRVFIFDHNVRNAGRPRISPHAPRPCHGRGSHGGGLICVSIATWQQYEPAWARGVNLASKPRFAS